MSKLTIKQIKDSVTANVNNVVGVYKQPGTNFYNVHVKDAADVETALNQLEDIGFTVAKTDAALRIAKAYKSIVAAFNFTSDTYYGRQIHVYGGATQ